MRIDNTEVIIANQYSWKIVTKNNTKGWFVGAGIDGLFDLDFDNIENLVSWLSNKKGNFCGICNTSEYLISYVDRVRSYPLFYSIVNNKLYISDQANELATLNGKYDENSVLELQMSNFISGKKTIFKNVFQIKPGEVLIYNKTNAILKKIKYYSYYSDNIITNLKRS